MGGPPSGQDETLKKGMLVGCPSVFSLASTSANVQVVVFSDKRYFCHSIFDICLVSLSIVSILRKITYILNTYCKQSMPAETDNFPGWMILLDFVCNFRTASVFSAWLAVVLGLVAPQKSCSDSRNDRIWKLERIILIDTY